jgi:glycosyltransferase involved in cell wall biosynthesis
MDPPRLTLHYLLADTALFGGTKVALHQANLMAMRGHRVTVLSPASAPTWYPLAARYVRVDHLEQAACGRADVTVATFWTTLGPAARQAAAYGGEALHYCQGLEETYTHNHDEHEAIRRAYELPLPAITVAPHLAAALTQRFHRPARVVPQPLEPFWRPRLRLGPRRRSPPRIAVFSPFEIDWKGVRTALAAVRLLRARGVACQLVRLSQWPLGDAERALLPADEYHHHLPPPAVARLLAGCDLVLAPSWEQEGFGLPALEAMACGVPVIASDVSCYRDFAGAAAWLVRFDDPAAFAAAAADCLDRGGQWRAMRRRGLRIAASYREDRAAEVAEEALYWAADGRWRAA